MSVLSPRPFVPCHMDEQTVTNWRLIIATGLGVVALVAALFGISTVLPPKAQPASAEPLSQAKAAPPLKGNRPVPVAAQIRPTEERERRQEKEVPPLPTRPLLQEKPISRTAKALERSSVPARRPTVPAKREQLPVASPIRPPQKPAEPLPLVIKRRDHLDEEKLAEALRKAARTIDLDSVAGTSATLLQRSKGAPDKATKARTILDLLPMRPDLMGLPVGQAQVCKLDQRTAQRLASFSLGLRSLLMLLEQRTAEVGREGAVNYLEHEMLINSFHPSAALASRRAASAAAPLGPNDWLQGDAVGPLVQVLQSEDKWVRRLLVRLLARSSDPAATAALAKRAIFDLSEDVRGEALLALSLRPRGESRQVLLDGLRYPWPPVADHAAEAVVALRDREALPSLVELLDKPDPAAPCLEKNHTWVKPELVSVNHLRHCALCHAPSFSSGDLVRAPVPSPGKPLPPGIAYYELSQGPQIRADVTYLLQDFSVRQGVSDHGAWPELQRFDYMIRKRALTPEEGACLENSKKVAQKGVSTYRQRESVLFALRELSGQDLGSATEEWKKMLGNGKFKQGRTGQ